MSDIYSKPILSIRDQLWLANWVRPLLLALYELGVWSALICASMVGPWKDWSLYLCGAAAVRMAIEMFRQQRAIGRTDKRLEKLDAELESNWPASVR